MEPDQIMLDNMQPLTPAVFHILLALVDEEQHGYGIMKDVEFRTEGQMLLKPGTLYQAIKRLLDDGLIKESDKREDANAGDSRRRYYRLTSFGRRVLKAESQRLERMVQLARAKHILGEAKVALKP
ncbi:MAG: PadR family transcriptional regulator [Anaerolineae bacterium]|nr:PadR family transcriptional regulator [Anaerolineae bacterium]